MTIKVGENRRDKHSWIIQRHRQQRAQDEEQRQTKKKRHDTETNMMSKTVRIIKPGVNPGEPK